MNLWAASLLAHNDEPPFADHNDMLNVIDSSIEGDVPWQSFKVSYSGDIPHHDAPSWMTKSYDVWFRDPRACALNILSSPDFDGEIDYSAYREFKPEGSRVFKDFMSANWAWRHSVSPIVILLRWGAYANQRIKLPRIRIPMVQCLCQ